MILTSSTILTILPDIKVK